jgi:polar amino acid transport system ATP-binding protein
MRDEVRAVLRRVAQENVGLTIVLATHEMRLATELADRIWVMQAGRIVERGAPADLVARPASDVAREFFGPLGRIPS